MVSSREKRHSTFEALFYTKLFYTNWRMAISDLCRFFRHCVPLLDKNDVRKIKASLRAADGTGGSGANMEIAPISGIRVTPAIKPQPNDPQLTAVFDIEAAVKPDDDSYWASSGKAAGAEEEDGDDLDSEAGEADAGPVAHSVDEDAIGSISYFA